MGCSLEMLTTPLDGVRYEPVFVPAAAFKTAREIK